MPIERLEQAGICGGVAENGETMRNNDKNYLPCTENYFLFCNLHFDYHRLEHLYKVYYVCTPDEENHIDAGGLPLVRYTPCGFLLSRRKAQRGIAIFSSFIHSDDDIVFGDGMNDIRNVRSGWLSMMGKMPAPRSAEKADHITTDVDKDGTPAGILAGF